MTVGTKETAAIIDEVAVSAYKISTSSPEVDGSYAWNSTTIVVVEAAAAHQSGIGSGYSGAATARLIKDSLVELICSKSGGDVPAAWTAVVQAGRQTAATHRSGSSGRSVLSGIGSTSAQSSGSPVNTSRSQVKGSRLCRCALLVRLPLAPCTRSIRQSTRRWLRIAIGRSCRWETLSSAASI
jgi:hypothetical protein